MAKTYRIKAPKLGNSCARCHRRLDTRMVGNPFGQWSIPVVSAAPRGTFCWYCYDIVARNFDALTHISPECKAAEQLTQWLAQPCGEGK